MEIVTCAAPATSTTRCTRRAAVTLKIKVPGGTLKGPACLNHVEVVKAMLEAEAAHRVMPSF